MNEQNMVMTERGEPSTLELFTPKLVTILREGYGLADLKADAIAGLTVAIVALPLSMAIAIASGVTPERGLYTSIIGGFVVSLLGGSRFQVGGPAGAFFFGAAASVAAALDRIGAHPRCYVIDFSAVPFIDSTAAATIDGFARKARRHGAAVYLAGARAPIHRVLIAHGVRPPDVHFAGISPRR